MTGGACGEPADCTTKSAARDLYLEMSRLIRQDVVSNLQVNLQFSVIYPPQRASAFNPDCFFFCSQLILFCRLFHA